MHQHLGPVLNTASDVLAWVILALLVGYVVRYWRRTEWRSTLVGRTTMWHSLAVVALLGTAIFTTRLGLDNAARPYIRIVTYSFLVWTSWQAYWTMARYQRFAAGSAPDPDLTDPVPSRRSPYKG